MRGVFLLALAVLLGSFSSLKATHFMGGEIWYEHQGGCIYKVYTDIYYDCAGAAWVNNTPVSQFQPGSSNSLTVNPTDLSLNGIGGNCGPVAYDTASIILYQEATPICPVLLNAPVGVNYPTACENLVNPIYNGIAVVRTEYQYDLCGYACTQFELVWENCCRSQGITNLEVPNQEYMTFGNLVIDLNLPQGNNSPIFNDLSNGGYGRDAYACAGQPSVIDLSAFDPDGDSLSYALVPVWSQDTSVTYDSLYTPQQPLGPNWLVSLDSISGLFSLTPNPTGSIEVAVVGIEISEWRNGVLIGKSLRDVQINIFICGANGTPQFDAFTLQSGGTLTGAQEIQATVGDTLDFTLVFSDVDSLDTLSLVSTPLINFPSGSLTTTGTNPLSISVHLPLAGANLFGNSFTLPFVIEDQNCPVTSQAATYLTVNLNTLSVFGTVTETVCGDSTGQIDLSIDGLGQPFTILWNTGDSTEDLTGLAAGVYEVIVSNTLGEADTQSFVVPGGSLDLSYTIQAPDCDSSNGSIDLTVTGGFTGLSYLWSTGDSTQDISGLLPGGYNVEVSDDSGCFNREIILLDEADSCRATLSGTVYVDANGNCQQDANEAGVADILIDLTPGGAVLTDSNGFYVFEVPTGNFDVSTIIPSNLSNTCIPSGTYGVSVQSLNDDQANLDFGLDTSPVREMVAFQQINQNPVPGQVRRYHLFASNQGGVTISGDVNWYYDPNVVSIAYMDPVGDTLTPGVVSWPYSMVAPNTSQVFRVDVSFDTLLTIGDSINSRLEVLPLAGDVDKPNNRDTLLAPVLNSFDPNDKLVTPAGVGPFGLIPPEELTHSYTVRFQNTGTFAASTVIIRDTLDPQLDPLTFKLLGQSHAVQTRILADSILVFLFENINLPDSASDPVGSTGFVSFELDRLPNLPLGTQIRNQAAIYFDYNPPIITNEVINTLYRFPSLAVSLPDEFCEEEPLIARVTQGFPPFRYTWNGSNDGPSNARRDTLLLSESGWYRLSIIDSFGISLQDSFLIQVAPLPEASFSYQFQTDSSDRLVAFTSTLQDTDEVLWDFGDGTQSNELNPVHLFPLGGNYLVTLSASNECGTRVDSQAIGVVSGIGNWANGWALYPNPGKESVYLLGLVNQSYVLTLQDLQGRNVWVEQGSGRSSIEIDRRGLPAGLYLLRVESNWGAAVMKLRWE